MDIFILWMAQNSPLFLTRLNLIPDKPSAPRDLRVVDQSESSVSLSWTPPRDDGGSKITGYVVEKRDALRMGWQSAGTTRDTHFKVNSIQNTCGYCINNVNKVKTLLPEKGEYRQLSQEANSTGKNDLKLSWR